MANNSNDRLFKRYLIFLAQDFKVWLEELKSKCDIVSVISKYCHLVQKGRTYWTCCPFHMEKTPSMCIYDYEQVYHCYGCKEHGDVVKFVQKIESCDFMQAVELLAKSVGMEVPNFSTTDSAGIEKRKKDKDLALEILNEAKNHYIQNLYLPVAKPAQDYIKKRLLTKKELDDFGIGYSVNYNEMPEYLRKKGYTYEQMKAVGLVEKGDNGYYDVFAHRLMFPLFNVYNECVGFSARILTDDKTKAKYRNSSQTIVFDKSNTIFGLNLVRTLKAKQGVDNIVIVEGQMDVIAMHKAGFKNAVACLGTAFTPKHAKQLKLISSNVVVCLDGDSAGLNAANKIVDVLAEDGFNVRVVKLPDGNDPDEYIKAHGIESMKSQIENAIDYIDFQIDYLARGVDFSKSDEKAKFVRESIALLDKLGSNSEKQIYLKHIKDKSGVPVDILQQDIFKRGIVSQPKPPQIENADVANLEDGTNRAIKFILAAMMYKEPYVNYNFNLKKYLKNDTYVKLYDLIMQKYAENKTFKVSVLYDYFDFDSESNLKDIVNYNFENNGNNEKYYNECLWNIVEKDLKMQQAELNEKYQKETDSEERKKILLKVSEITKKLKNKVMED